MKIFGIGTDIINVKRMKKSLQNNGEVFKKKFFLKMKLHIVKREKIPFLIMLKDLLLKKP